MAEILLIDDVSVVRTALCKFMSRAGHVVTECGGGDEAWSTLSQRRFDLIVTDLWMKEGTGLDFIKRTRAAGVRTPVIAITSGDLNSPAAGSKSVALGAGADRVLLKPVMRPILLDTIAQLIGVSAQ